MADRTGTVADISDAELVERAVRNAVLQRGPWVYPFSAPWVSPFSAISRAFGLGSTYSRQLCRRFGIDPDTGEPIVPRAQAETEQDKDRRIASLRHRIKVADALILMLTSGDGELSRKGWESAHAYMAEFADSPDNSEIDKS